MGDPSETVEKLMDQVEEDILGEDNEILREIEQSDWGDEEEMKLERSITEGSFQAIDITGFEEIVGAIRILNSQITELRTEIQELNQELQESEGLTLMAGISVEKEEEISELIKFLQD